MDFLSQATNVSNWTLSLIMGFTSALQSGSENGIVGELPFCDILLTVDPREVPNGISGDNVFIGFESKWSKMMLRNFYSKRLDFCYLMPRRDKSNEDSQLSGPERKCECHMVVNPMWKRWKDDEAKCGDDGPKSDEETGLLQKQKKPRAIEPNMFYGLVEDYPPPPPKKDNEQETQTKSEEITKSYKIIHSPECIPNSEIDPRAVEFLPEYLLSALKGKTNREALERCEKIIKCMGKAVSSCKEANEWDKRIIERLYKVMKYPDLEEAYNENIPIDEVIDRVHSRIPKMLQNLKLTEFQESERDSKFTIEDVTRAIIIYFGIKRAVEFSRRIHEENALVFMGYNVEVGHEIVRDMTEIPSTLTSGFSAKTVLESTSSKRIVDVKVEPTFIFMLAIVLDTVLAPGIMILSGLGPILSMFTARRMTAPYRESYMRMGTTMRWTVDNVTILYTGSARDDWMVCLQPTKEINRKIFGFLCLALASSLSCAIIWVLPVSHQQIMNPDLLLSEDGPLINMFGKLVCVLSLFIGFPWVIMAQFVQANNEKPWIQHLWSTAMLHTIVNLALVVLLSALVFGGIEYPWVYLYLLEAVYLGQWFIGELADNWCYESTAFLMIGVLGAVRLCNLPDSD